MLLSGLPPGTHSLCLHDLGTALAWVTTWLPASGRFYCSLASRPEGGRGKVIKAETRTSALCYLVTVLVNDGTGGEEIEVVGFP